MAAAHTLTLALVTLVLSGAGCGGPTGTPSERAPVVIAGRTFHLELALTTPARIQGLSDRREIAADGGMLFAFPEPEPLTFVMRRCLVPIDILFLDARGRVITTHAMQVEPYARTDGELKPYDSVQPAQFAIELRGGTLQALPVKPGDRIEFPLDDLKQRAR